MKLEKAIEIGSYNGLKPEGTTWGEYLEAIQLLAEAGERILKERRIEDDPDWGRLFSETQE